MHPFKIEIQSYIGDKPKPIPMLEISNLNPIMRAITYNYTNPFCEKFI